MAFASSMLFGCGEEITKNGIEETLREIKRNPAVYSAVVDEVVKTMREYPNLYEDKLLDCAASAFDNFPKQTADIGGYVLTRNALTKIGWSGKR